MKFPLLWVFLVLLTLPLTSQARFSTVVIDAGHGGHDRGGIRGQKLCEKDYCLDVARRVRLILNQAGIKTVMTRNSDTFISLGKRVAIGNRPGAVLVSIHFNSARRLGADGPETFYYHPKSARLASHIHSKIARLGNGENRGLKRARFYVLKKSKVPAVLVEPGFLTNPDYARLISKSSQRDRLAAALASGIISSSRD